MKLKQTRCSIDFTSDSHHMEIRKKRREGSQSGSSYKVMTSNSNKERSSPIEHYERHHYIISSADI